MQGAQMSDNDIRYYRDALKEEYFYLQKRVADYDQHLITTKAWSITLSMLAVGTAFTQKIPVLLLLAGLASVLFWIIEAFWKSFQRAFYPRIQVIEAAFAEGRTIPPLQMNASAVATWNPKWRIAVVGAMFFPYVALPHVVVAIGGPSLYFLNMVVQIVPSP
jgi:hypothetical protein